MAKARRPHLKLKALRKITGLTQQQLADRASLKYSYLIQVETGQKPLSKPMAELISRATGISALWLTDENIGVDAPLSRFNDEGFDRQYFLSYSSQTLTDDIHPYSSPSAWSVHFCKEITLLMRAAERKGTAAVCSYLLESVRLELLKRMRLEAVLADESNGVQFVEALIFGPRRLPEIERECDDRDVLAAWNLLSASGLIRWASALTKKPQDGDKLIDDLQTLKAMVELSIRGLRNRRYRAKRASQIRNAKPAVRRTAG